MHFTRFLPCVLIPFAAAAPAEKIPVAPLVSSFPHPFNCELGIGLYLAKNLNQKVTLYHEYDWVGEQFNVRSLRACVQVSGSLYVCLLLLLPLLPISSFKAFD
jgi:hypothetical protein